jgi:SM-20-related protein
LDLGISEGRLTILDFDRLNAVPLERDPFDFVVVEEFIRNDVLGAVVADFPAVGKAGSYPIDGLKYGSAFSALAAELTGWDLAAAIGAKFGIDLDGRPTLLTVRGMGDSRDGYIHTDTETKIITLLLYMNPVWPYSEGRLRLLRGANDIDDYAREIVPLAGTMLAFRRSERSFHGHLPFIGPRRTIQLNWVRDHSVVRRELGRHRWSARLKALNPFTRAA